jgi:hypothetical protein
MGSLRLIVLFWLLGAMAGANAADAPADANPAIDIPGYLRLAREAAAHRETHRVSEQDFIRMSRETGTVVLDARSREKYDQLHVQGAVNLSFPDLTAASLESLIGDKDTRILIYCNNNFAGASGPFPSKLPSAALNLSTFIALYTYGYRNVYELAPYVELASSRLQFESSTLMQTVGP